MLKTSFLPTNAPASRKSKQAESVAEAMARVRRSGAFFTVVQKKKLRAAELSVGQVISGDPRGKTPDFSEEGYVKA